ncbi:MAG: glycosyl transferase family 4 [Bacteroidetes bacterium]|nr:MAG: glycosyl transferase family 4 [Bacteroidota bacterium]
MGSGTFWRCTNHIYTSERKDKKGIMKILQICHKTPYPPRDGGSIAMNNLTQGLIDHGHEVKVLAMNTPKSFIDIDKLPADYRKNTSIEAVFIDTNIKIIDAFLNLFKSSSYNIDRFISKDFETKLKDILEAGSFDVVQLESLFLVPYLDVIRKYSSAKVVMRAHNVEFEIWMRRMQACKNILKKQYLNLLANRLKTYEVDHINSYDGIAAITPRDAEMLRLHGCTIPITDIPIGMDLIDSEAIPRKSHGSPTSLFHLGSMDWMPNQEAIKWFLDDVWPKITKAFPNLKLNLAGRNMPDWILKSNFHNVIVEGEINNVKEYMASEDIMIVPLISGSGMRVKIIEGMAFGKVIISTSVGAEGINYEHEKDILIANTANEYVEMVGKCFSDNDLYHDIGDNARVLARSQYDNKVIAEKLISFYKSLF